MVVTSEHRVAGASSTPTLEQVWIWLREVPDPEIPVVSVVDLGIVRDVIWRRAATDGEPEECVVTITPTYSGCPATEVIGSQIREALRSQGIEHVRLRIQLSPAWTTDWMTTEARAKLRAYGIAPPEAAMHSEIVASARGADTGCKNAGRAGGTDTCSGKAKGAQSPEQVIGISYLRRRPQSKLGVARVVEHSRFAIECPRCASANTESISEFGSTPCKALRRCLDCLEPFDHFKCH